MINANKVKKYIEEKNGIELAPIQFQILKAIIRGDEVYTARAIGRSLLYNGYADYLKEVVGKDTNREVKSDEYDSIFTADMAMNDSRFVKLGLERTFERLKRFDEEYLYKK